MKRKNSPSRQQEEDAESQYHELRMQRHSSGSLSYFKYVPFAVVFSLLCLILYVTVGGVDIKKDIAYVIVAYAIGVFGLTISYTRVSAWVIKQRSVQMKNNKKGTKNEVKATEGLWFTLFYNNTFYLFLLLINSHLIFSTLQPTASMILSQLCASLIPAWMSTLSK